jgi:hypothetical protein
MPTSFRNPQFKMNFGEWLDYSAVAQGIAGSTKQNPTGLKKRGKC